MKNRREVVSSSATSLHVQLSQYLFDRRTYVLIGRGFAVVMIVFSPLCYVTCVNVPPINKERSENDCEIIYFSENSIHEQLCELVFDRRTYLLIGRGFAVVMICCSSVVYETCLNIPPIKRERSENDSERESS